MAARKGKRKLSSAEVGQQHAAELPDREAMSLVLPSTGGLPMLGGTDPTAAGAGYTAGAPDTALSQTQDAQHLATSPPSGGMSAPNGTASSTATS